MIRSGATFICVVQSIVENGYQGNRSAFTRVRADSPWHLPVLEEGLQGLADSVPLLDGQQVLQLLAKGAPVDFNARRKDFCHPLQRAEGW